MTMQVPIVDIAARYRSTQDEVKKAVLSVFESGQFILGPEVTALEKEAAEYIGTEEAIGVASGTDALHLALLACGIGKGDEVITTPFTFVATAEAIAYTGATPVLADILPDTCNIDPEEIGGKITARTRAILPVHMYGQASDMGPVMTLAERHGLKVIEDTAQALGGRYRGNKLSGIGDAGCTSFFPTKNLGGAGDGGMVFTNNATIAEKVRMLRVHGSRSKYVHQVLGFNSRLDSVQAAVLRVHLRRLDAWNDLRRRHARRYDERLKGNEGILIPRELPGNHHVYHLYSVRVREREECAKFLRRRGVSTAIHYPASIFQQEAFRGLGYSEQDLPVSAGVSKEVLSLPMYPELKEEQIDYVSDCLLEFFH